VNIYTNYCLGSMGATRPVSGRIFRAKMRELESDFGFKVATLAMPGDAGHIAVYLGLQKSAPKKIPTAA